MLSPRTIIQSMEIVDKTHLLIDNPIDSSYGVTIQDFDADGLLEIFVATQNGPNHLYKWSNGGFVEVTPNHLKDAACCAISVTAGDLTRNGLPDIYVLNAGTFSGSLTEPDRLFVNLGDLHFEDMLVAHPDRNIAAGRSVCWTDPTNSGWYAPYIVNYGAPNMLYVNDGRGYFRNEAPVGHGLGAIVGGRTAISQDLFDTGRMDIVVLNEGGPNLLFRNREEAYEECAAALGLDDPDEHGRGLAVCDFNRDGLMDLVYVNWQGPHRAMQQLIEGGFVDVASPALAAPSSARNLIAADLDNDGWEELFINNHGEANRLLKWIDGEFVEIDCGAMLLPDGTGTGASCGDLDSDGMLEIYVCHGESMEQRNRLFSCAQNDNHWVRIQPLTPAGAPAIGARVQIRFERPMTRFIDGGSGYLCQMEPVAHFGLGAITELPEVHIRWSDRTEALFRNLPIDRLTQIPHPNSLEEFRSQGSS